MTEAIEGHVRRSKEGGWSEWVEGSRFPGAGENVKVSPAFLGFLMSRPSRFSEELDIRLSIVEGSQGNCVNIINQRIFLQDVRGSSKDRGGRNWSNNGTR